MDYNLVTIRVSPKLVDGRVLAYLRDGNYLLLKPFNGVEISDNFNPRDFMLVNNTRYYGIGYASTKSQKEADVYLSYHLLKVREIAAKKINIYRGCIVHLYSNEGLYRVVSYSNKLIEVTCNKWFKPRVMLRSNLKCIAGGNKNKRF